MIPLHRGTCILTGLVMFMVLGMSSPALGQAGKGNYSIRGAVLDPAGKPVPGAKVIGVLNDDADVSFDLEGNPVAVPGVVTLLLNTKAAVRREVETDENGRWAIRLIRRGLWTLQAFSEDHMSAVADIMVRMSKNDMELVLIQSDTGLLIEAKTAIYESRWEKAVETLEVFETCFPGSRQKDNALYWLAYGRRQLGDSTQDRLERSQHFSDAVEDLNRLIAGFPESEWRDDAMVLRIEIALPLVQLGQARYESLILEGLETREPDQISVRLAALKAYTFIDRKKAVQLLMEIASAYQDPAARRKSIYILGSTGGKDLMPFLSKVAEQDPEESVRRAARIWLK